ncbi:MAG: arginase [Acidobacteriia bacterium]|nr:arginase [Terriglobia bacterium]MBV8907162.1 arginase [Terriglobia bacterium]
MRRLEGDCKPSPPRRATAHPAHPAQVAIIGAPLDLGAGRRGVDMGPSALRVANLNSRIALLGYTVEDLGNVEVAQAETASPGNVRAKYLPQIAVTCQHLANAVGQCLASGRLPVALGGDHSLAIGTASGVSHHYRERGEKVGIVWLDAHADMNTPESSPSGNVHGMPLACIVGFGPEELTGLFGYSPKVDPHNAAIVGLRDVDAAEKPQVRDSGVSASTMRDIDERGLRAVMVEAIGRASEGTAGFVLSLDMDFVDPRDAPGVGTPVRGGVTYREAHLAMEMICDSGKMLAMEVVEVNPVIDEVNRTADLAVELVMSALGKRIL